MTNYPPVPTIPGEPITMEDLAGEVIYAGASMRDAHAEAFALLEAEPLRPKNGRRSPRPSPRISRRLSANAQGWVVLTRRGRSRLTPVGDAVCVVLMSKVAVIPRRELGPIIDSARDKRNDITAARDLIISYLKIVICYHNDIRFILG